MNTAFSEIPLAIFTTFAPIGAGAFIALALALLKDNLSEKQLQHADKWTLVPALFILVGLGASVAHLGDPGHILSAVSGFGASPLTNEVISGCILITLALLYVIIGFMGKFSTASRKLFACIVALAALVFAIFTGLAYMIPTIASWSSPLSIVQICGFALVGGAAFLPLLLKEFEGQGSLVAGIIAALGVLCAVIGVAGTALLTNGLSNAAINGASLVSEALPYIVAGLLLICLSAVFTWMQAKKTTQTFAWIALTCAILGIFLARLAFYGLQLSVGLSL